MKTIKKYQNGGYQEPMTEEEIEFLRDQRRFDKGAGLAINKEIRKRDRRNRQIGRQTGYYPADEQEVSVLLDMLQNDQLDREDIIRKGKRRIGLEQAASLMAGPLLASLVAGKTAQNQIERQRHQTGLEGYQRPSFGEALRIALGLQ